MIPMYHNIRSELSNVEINSALQHRRTQPLPFTTITHDYLLFFNQLATPARKNSANSTAPNSRAPAQKARSS